MDEDLSIEFEVEQLNELRHAEEDAINEDCDRDLDKEIRYLLEID